jgi:hypothetical protein
MLATALLSGIVTDGLAEPTPAKCHQRISERDSLDDDRQCEPGRGAIRLPHHVRLTLACAAKSE